MEKERERGEDGRYLPLSSVHPGPCAIWDVLLLLSDMEFCVTPDQAIEYSMC